MRLVADISAWFRAVLRHWQVLVTGGLITAVLTVLQYWRAKSFTWAFAKWVFGAFLVWAFFLAWRDRDRAAEKAEADLDLEIEKGPRVIVEYVYAEDDTQNSDPNRPLRLRNTSTTETVLSVEVLPLETTDGSVAFQPSLISHIEPKGERNVFADLANDPKGNVSPILTRNLPHFLYRSYKNQSIEELMGTKNFRLRLSYGWGYGAAPKIETTCEILFTPWKRRTRIGKIAHRRVSGAAPSSVRRE